MHHDQVATASLYFLKGEGSGGGVGCFSDAQDDLPVSSWAHRDGVADDHDGASRALCDV
ncbi:hypothetical protein OOK48_25400 [Streptomyces viridodiastaticus]|uniref:hypothetical protein n=1 Tax=Streptomyces albogriseolus TaxID=1887 RepID=UPI00225A0368|nr:hypothetical protein [Streptomyces viridodiastaticus]MCX4569673.1 hypothetical protein [Streptomyces viridodiastaticus]